MIGAQLTLWMVLYSFAAAICFWVAYRSWKMRPAPGAVCFSGAATCWGWWALGDLLYLFGSTLAWKLFAVRFEFIGITGAVFFWTLFIFDYTGLRRIDKTLVFASGIVPAIMLVVVQTLHMHHLIYTHTGVVRVGSMVALDRIIGPAFWAWALYAYCILFLGALALIIFAFRSPQIFRDQAFLLATGALLPTVVNILYLTGHDLIGTLDPSSLTFAISGFIV